MTRSEVEALGRDRTQTIDGGLTMQLMRCDPFAAGDRGPPARSPCSGRRSTRTSSSRPASPQGRRQHDRALHRRPAIAQRPAPIPPELDPGPRLIERKSGKYELDERLFSDRLMPGDRATLLMLEDLDRDAPRPAKSGSAAPATTTANDRGRAVSCDPTHRRPAPTRPDRLRPGPTGSDQARLAGRAAPG